MPGRQVLATEGSSVLDFLRASAVSLVLIDHIVEATRNEPLVWVAQRLGWMGVMLFFVHTSLVLMFSLERTRAKGTALLKHFYVRRAFRIYPLSVFVVLAILAFHLPVASSTYRSTVVSVPTAIANLLLVQNLVYAPSVLGPLWTLPLEMQMYVVLPLLFWIVSRGQRLGLSIVVWFVCVGLAFVQPLVIGRADVLQYAPCFMSGVLAFCLSKRQAAVWPFWIWVIALGAAMLAFLALAAPYGQATPMALSWGLSVTVGWLIPHFQETTSHVVRRVSAIIAKYSYGIYLMHTIALWVPLVALSHASLATRVLAGASLIVLLPLLAYHLVEAPGIGMGAQLAARFLERKTAFGNRAGAAASDSLMITTSS